ncbi:MAG: hypothetical protein AAB499_00535 [Patescibacteria group bacterium]
MESIIAWSTLVGIVTAAITLLPILNRKQGKWNERLFLAADIVALGCLVVIILANLAVAVSFFYRLVV